MAPRGSFVLQVLTPAALAVVAAAALAGCGSDGGSSAAGGGTPAAQATPAAASGTSPAGTSAAASGPTVTDGPTWRDYFALRIGRECTSGVGGGAGQSTKLAEKSRVTEVADNGSSVAFTIEATALDENGEEGPAHRLPYRIDRDGSMRVTPSVQDAGAVRVRLNGFELYPSLADLAAGKKVPSTLTASLEGTTAAARKALAAGLKPGESAPELAIELRTGPAPEKSSVRTPGGKFSDLVGVRTRATSVKYTNLTAQATASSAPALASLRKAFSTTTYFARQTGPVLTKAFGQTIQLQGCNG